MRTYGELRHGGGKGRRPVFGISAEPHVMIRLKRIFPRAEGSRSGELFLSDTPETAADLAWVLERWPLDMNEAARKHLDERAREYSDTRDAVTSILDGNHVQMTGMAPALEPRDYQLAAADIVLQTGRLLLADDLGLGKTFSSLLVLRDPDALPALVVTLTHLPRQWLAELEKCLPWLTGHIITSGMPYDPAKKRGAGGYDPDVLIINYAKLAGWGHHLAGRIRTIIFDEAQELRHGGTLKYENAALIADRARYAMGLTATPVYNYGGEIHNVLSVLDADALGDRAEFAREWCTGDGDKLRVKDPAALGTYLREEGLLLRRTRTQVGRELPDVQRVPHTIDVDESVLDAESAGAEELARMIVEKSGTNSELFRAAGDFDWRLRHATGIAKANYVADFVRILLESEEPVVLFGWHRDVYDKWATRLADKNPAFYTGEESPAQKRAAQSAFLDGHTDLLIMSLRAGAGLDGLQERSRVCVFGELDWSPGVHEQCIGRLNRDGQGDPVIAYFLVAESGADPAIAEVLDLKRQQSERIVDPDRPLLTESDANTDRVKLLAQQWLQRQGAHSAK